MYSTEFCPRNQVEWNLRSSAINCTNTNGYMCIPNENLTELLEFCYIYHRILIQKGTENLEDAIGKCIKDHCGLLNGISIVNFMTSQNLRCLIIYIFYYKYFDCIVYFFHLQYTIQIFKKMQYT